MWFQPPLTELSPDTYEPLKKPHFAGPAVISDPYWLDRQVRTEPQIVFVPDGRASRRIRWLKRGLVDVSCRVKLYELLALVVLGSGIMLISASAFGSRRFDGIWLPAKQPAPPAVGLHAE